MKIPDKLIKPLIAIAFIIILCSFLARMINSSETLAEYANANPELAYASTEEADETAENTETTMTDENTADTNSAKKNAVEAAESTTTAENIDFIDEYADSTHRIKGSDGFFYEPIPQSVLERIWNISYPEDATVPLEDLRYMNVLYYDFQDEIQTGELICSQTIAQDLLEIFEDLYKAGYQIEKIKLIDEYQGDDHLAMLDNNTSCFNYRTVDDTTKLSKHAYGLAIDINPFYNPYVTYSDGQTHVSPEGSEPYADRTADFPYKIDENDLCYKLFKAHGFTWGGNWNSCKDYQHFQKN